MTVSHLTGVRCHNNGECIRLSENYEDKGFDCFCPKGFTGDFCEQDVDDCEEGRSDLKFYCIWIGP